MYYYAKWTGPDGYRYVADRDSLASDYASTVGVGQSNGPVTLYASEGPTATERVVTVGTPEEVLAAWPA